MKTVAYALAAVAMLTAAGTAEARSRDDGIVTARITIGDLDLSKTAGREALDRRVAAAARELCEAPSYADPKAQASYRACRREVMESANRQVAMVMSRYAGLEAAPTAD
jgi:UrcA family protein